ncbi:MAG: DUF2231 domain-containing protein [Blastocatellia bacterium]
MESRAKLFGHALHPILIVFPLGLLATTVIFDTIYLFTDNRMMTVVAYWMLVAGVIGGLVAAVFGVVDWLAIPSNTRAKRIGTLHGVGNVIVVLLFIGSWWLRRGDPALPSTEALALSYVGVGLVMVTGWLGGELVERLGVGVDNGAHLDSPSSLSHRSASDTTAKV